MGLLQRVGLLETTKPIEVSVAHIPYVESLWMRLEDAKQRLSVKQDYLRTVGSLGVKVDALTAVADATLANERAIRSGQVELERIKKVLAYGCEPTTPPEWFCGHLTEPEKNKDGRYRAERWPQRGDYYNNRDQTRVFKGPVPAKALQRYAVVSTLIDDARIYAPEVDQFETLRNPEPFDPVLIGMIMFLGEREYFEIDRWDVDLDLATIFGNG